eukprot:7382480-Prorocentrum_lima.AAC.1
MSPYENQPDQVAGSTIQIVSPKGEAESEKTFVHQLCEACGLLVIIDNLAEIHIILIGDQARWHNLK